MSSVAEQLRMAREAQNLSLGDLAEMTKIRSDHLDALEHADYTPFPAPVYIRGSIRTYALVLKLDVPAVLARLDAELAESPEFSEPPSLTGGRRGPLDWVTYQLSRMNWRVAGVAGGILALTLGCVWGWRAWTQRVREDPLSQLGTGMYQAPSNLVSEGDVLRLPTNGLPGRP